MQASLNLTIAPLLPIHTSSTTRRQGFSIPAAGTPTDTARIRALRPTQYSLHMLPLLMST
jgi:hypothetical protein